METNKKIVCFHLLNDYSGSPKVLSQSIRALVNEGYEVDLYTSKSDGFLSKIKGVTFFDINYSLKKNKLFTLLVLLWSQLKLIYHLKKYKSKNVVFYVNTILPFGAALAGKILKKEVVYHVHETSISPWLWKAFLVFVMKHTANRLIFVSEYLKEKEGIEKIPSCVIYNALPSDFENISISKKKLSGVILMACSLKKYKGILEFLKLAEYHPTLCFNLVLNATQKEITEFFTHYKVPANVHLFPKQSQLHAFYQSADVVLNLSVPSQWIETFGLTIIEAMAYGLPTIVPPVGGPKEIVSHQVNGFQYKSCDFKLISDTLTKLFTNQQFYNEISRAAKQKAKEFSPKMFNISILRAFRFI